MSRKDFMRDGALIRTIFGRAFKLSVATNSLKFSFDFETPGQSYLWIDPSWLLRDSDGHVIVDSGDCPRDTEAFRDWARVLDVLRPTELTHIDASEDATSFVFQNGMTLLSQAGTDDGEESWYDDYYFRSATDS